MSQAFHISFNTIHSAKILGNGGTRINKECYVEIQ